MLIAALLVTVVSHSQTRTGTKPIAPPPPPPASQYSNPNKQDSIAMPSAVQPTIPRDYDDYAGKEYAADISTPENIKTEVTYDPELGMYVIRTKLGENEIVTPYLSLIHI